MSHIVSMPNSSASLPHSLDQQRLLQRKKQILPWIANPLHLFLEHEHGHGHHGHHQPVATGDGHSSEHKHPHTDTSASRENRIYEEVEAEEAHPLELFYDLFFVANLTTITSVHVMTDYDSMVGYVLFFVVLWFTWLQTTLYDIRFTNDSFYERIVRAIHFAVMIGFASVSTNWTPLEPKYSKAHQNLMSMTLTLMISRIALGVQYGIATIYAARLFKKGILPLLIHTITMFIAAFIYLGLYFAFEHSAKRTFLIWYGVIAFELFAVMGSSMKWKVVSFKQTHLVERMGLLTLIVIGEGIIVMLKAVNTVEKGAGWGRGWTPSIFFVVACAVLILFMLYMFYFDYTPRGVHYGTIRQQFWAVLHFPFHLAIVLSVEGLRQLTTWWSFYQAQDSIISRILAPISDMNVEADPYAAWLKFVDEIQGFLQFLYDDGTAKDVVKNWDSLLIEMDRLRALDPADGNIDEYGSASFINFNQILFDLASGFAEWYGIKVPKKSEKPTVGQLVAEGKSIEEHNPEVTVMKVYDLVYTYFFCALGVVFFMYGVFGLFVRRKKDGWDYFSVVWRFAIGLTFIGMERIKSNASLYEPFMSSFWPIPSVAIILFIALCVDKGFGWLSYKKLKASLVY